MSGSLRFTGPLSLIQSGSAGNQNWFASQASATFGMDFRYNAAPSFVGGSPAILLTFPNSFGYTPVVTWRGDTLLFYVLSNTPITYVINQVSVKVFQSVNYQLIVSWGPTTAFIALNGTIPGGASASTGGLTTYGGYADAVIGVDNQQAGSSWDFQVQNVFGIGGYAFTAADCASYASGTPLSSIHAPSMLYTFGGTAGNHPALADAGLIDTVVGGSTATLAVNGGSLSNAVYAGDISTPTNAYQPGNYVSKGSNGRGSLVYFGATGLAPGPGGKPPVYAITAVNDAGLKVYRNGTQVPIGMAHWADIDHDWGQVAYPLQCGSVDGVGILDGGEDVIAPTVTAPGVTFGTPTVVTGVTSIVVHDGGSFGQPVAVVISGGGGAGARAHGIFWGSYLMSVVVDVGGSGYTSAPTATCGNAKLTAVVSGGAVAAIHVEDVGVSIYSPPTVSFSLPPGNSSGPNCAVAPTYNAVVGDANSATPGKIIAMIPMAGGVLGCGQGFDGPVRPTIAVNTGPAVANPSAWEINPVSQLNAHVNYRIRSSDGALSCTLNATVTGYNSTDQLNIYDPTGAGAAFNLHFTGPYLDGITPSGYLGTGYTAPSFTIAPAGNSVRLEPVVKKTISHVPVASGGDSNAPPTLTVTDTGYTGRPVKLVPHMGGVLPTDRMTADIPAGFLDVWTASDVFGTVGTPVGVSVPQLGVAVDNWSGRDEGASGGFSALANTHTMLPGVMLTGATANPDGTCFGGKNRLKTGGWGARGGTIPGTDATGRPLPWTAPNTTVAYCPFYGIHQYNVIDNMGMPQQWGQWTLSFIDPDVNTPTQMAAWLESLYQACVPVNQSGPAANLNTTTPTLATATASGGAITSISTSGLGTGWQAAIVVISDATGRGAVWTANVSGGAITGFNQVQPGNGLYSNNPTVSVYGAALASGRTNQTWYVGYGANPSTWQLQLSFNVASVPAASGPNAGKGVYTLSGEWAVPPSIVTRLAQPFDPTQPFAVDDAISGQLKGAGSGVLSPIRAMSYDSSYNNDSNYVLPSDIQDPSTFSWGGSATYSVTATQARFWKTDPADSAHAWSATPKVYGPHPWFTQGPDPSFNNNMYLTVPPGDHGAWLAPGTAYNQVAIELVFPSPHGLVGSRYYTFSGPGAVAISGGAITTSGGAITAVSAAGIAGTTWVAGTIPVSITDPTGSGAVVTPVVSSGSITGFTINSGGSGYTNPTIYLGGIPYTNQGNNQPANSPQQYYGNSLWPTGPNTAITTLRYVPFSVASGAVETVNFAGTIDLTNGGTSPGWTINWSVPYAGGVTPIEVAAANFAADAGTMGWICLSHIADDDWVRTTCDKVAANIGPTSLVALEDGNEVWNTLTDIYGFINPQVAQAMAYAPQVPGWLTYATPYGQAPRDDLGVPYGIIPLIAGHKFKVFRDQWVNVHGLAESRLRYIHGSQWDGSYKTLETLETCQRWGLPIHYVNVATYVGRPNAFDGGAVGKMTQVFRAMAMPGCPMDRAQYWSMAQYNDMLRNYFIYGHSIQANNGAHAGYCNGYGQPLRQLAITSAAGSTALAAGPYTVAVTFVDASGNETTPGASTSTFGQTAGNVSSFETPLLASWAAGGINVYLNNGTNWYLYDNISQATYNSTYQNYAHYSMTKALGSTLQSPPTTNNAAGNVPVMPRVIAYEGGPGNQFGVGPYFPFYAQLYHDSMFHPSYNDLIFGFLAGMEQGQQDMANGGLVGQAISSLAAVPQPYNYAIQLNYTTGQPAGDGLGNISHGGQTYAAPGPNKGATYAFLTGPADGHDHNGGPAGNVAPGLYGLQRFAAAIAATPTVLSRRFFPRLG